MINYKHIYMKIIPIGIALAPIGILFGILAAQENWSFIEVFFMSLIGFTGSGQFTFLGFVNQGLESVGYITAFIVILSINLRYIPMSLSATNHLNTNKFNKAWLGHWLADESYAVETSVDDIKSKIIIRLTIVIFWSLSTSAGVLLAKYIPNATNQLLIGLTFPVSAILILLSVSNVLEFNKSHKQLFNLLLSFITSILMILIIGAKYFWIPSIIICYLLLNYCKRITHEH